MSYTPRPLPQGFLVRPIAHRGLHDAGSGVIENTLPAFEAAMALGYGIECDVQPSVEGEPIVFHDHVLDRLTVEHGEVEARTAQNLLTLPFRAGTAGMLTLEDLFARIAGRVPLVVEVKSAFDGRTPQITRIAALAGRYAGPLVFKSFDPVQIIALRDAGVRQPLGIVAMTLLPEVDEARARAFGQLTHLDESRPDFLSWKAAELPLPQVAALRDNPGLPVMGWTVRSAEAARAAAPHLDQIVFEGFSPENTAQP
ncbi:MAG: glycerophosphodiester phosphodiesterase [Proteobacteria bacterium]|nr:glycerophosphodiester phosphodiesterase [Pseudomonadota bacterium]